MSTSSLVKVITFENWANLILNLFLSMSNDMQLGSRLRYDFIETDLVA
jgi:hypothetical protein